MSFPGGVGRAVGGQRAPGSCPRPCGPSRRRRRAPIEAGFAALGCDRVHCGAGGGVELPFGGTGQSGHGREKGFEALYGFSALKTVAARHG